MEANDHSATSSESSNTSKHSVSRTCRIKNPRSWWRITCVFFCYMRMNKNGRSFEYLDSGWVWRIGGALWNSCASTLHVFHFQQQRWNTYIHSASRFVFYPPTARYMYVADWLKLMEVLYKEQSLLTTQSVTCSKKFATISLPSKSTDAKM